MPSSSSDRPGQNMRGIREDVYQIGREWERILKANLEQSRDFWDADLYATEDGIPWSNRDQMWDHDRYHVLVKYLRLPDSRVGDVATQALVQSERSLRVLVSLKKYEALKVKLEKINFPKEKDVILYAQISKEMYDQNVELINKYNDNINLLVLLYSFIWNNLPAPNHAQRFDASSVKIFEDEWDLAKIEYNRRIEETMVKFEEKVYDMLHKDDDMEIPSYACYKRICAYLDKQASDEVVKCGYRIRLLVMLKENQADFEVLEAKNHDSWDDFRHWALVMYGTVLEALYHHLRTGGPALTTIMGFNLSDADIYHKDAISANTEYERRVAVIEARNEAEDNDNTERILSLKRAADDEALFAYNKSHRLADSLSYTTSPRYSQQSPSYEQMSPSYRP